MTSNKYKFLCLHLVLIMYAFSSVFSKYASTFPFLSIEFIMIYSIVIIILFLYALLWQQVLKAFPLNIAFANKSITVIWGMILGFFIFEEKITLNKLLGACIIIAGIYLVVKDNE